MMILQMKVVISYIFMIRNILILFPHRRFKLMLHTYMFTPVTHAFTLTLLI